jgi:hypothetical protein
MNRFSQFFSSFKEKLFRKKQELPKVQHSSVPAPKPHYVSVKKIRKPRGEKHIAFGTFSHLKWIGGHSVRHLGREFKGNFYKEYGVRLT